ncbi:phosphoenolpyruvate synthase [Deinococcus apachensis]|uniref:phosphoenolpyruvate synthase n=1 Tax=Deinococcus apachensis TaxID=309886 RepID=UPI000371C801|nr:phosphoenolpyruvate synthase [Deinococcus apachensis]
MTADVYVLPFAEIHAGDLPLVGGKGANLGELTAAGFPVPPGFCVTVRAFEQGLDALPERETMWRELEAIGPTDAAAARAASARWKPRLATLPLPQGVAGAIEDAWRTLGPGHAYAVRSSATAEDLPSASFAGQQDTFLNVRGREALLRAVLDCWASLYNERAISYRAQLGLSQRHVSLAVVVQRMIEPEVAGILFTADPSTGQRHIARIDATFGLGEALVSGVVTADAYSVDRRTRRVLHRAVADKPFAIRSAQGGGVERVPLRGPERNRPALTDVQVTELTELCGRIEAHYGAPQDIEWAQRGGHWYVLQTRPITTLYPLPEPRPNDGQLHAYFSFSHLQVMTDAMPPLAASVWQLLFPFGHPRTSLENPYLGVAGGRLYVDVSFALRHPLLRRLVPRAVGANVDAHIGGALAALATRPEFQHGPALHLSRAARGLAPVLRHALTALAFPERGNVASQQVRRIDARIARFRHALDAAPSLGARLDVALTTLATLLGPEVYPLLGRVMAGVLADTALRALARDVASRADLVALGAGQQGNVTTEMGLALGDLTDVARGQPAVSAHLRRLDLDVHQRLAVVGLPGGAAFLGRWQAFLARYGARGPGEIDLSRPRWHEDPGSLLSMVVGGLETGEPGIHRAQATEWRHRAADAAARVLRAAGPLRRVVLRHLLRSVRTYLPLREHPKFMLVQMLDLVKPVVLEAGVILTARGALDAPGDVWFLTLPELRSALAGVPQDLTPQVAARRARFAADARRTPPRVMTSDGELISAQVMGAWVPDGAFGGQAVSAGVVEGAARVMRRLDDPPVQPGEILVAPFTDPGWTPLFVFAAGLVTEVGGLMTHGSLVAREYGLPAVVGVERATSRIVSGQRLRVNGDLGYVELLDDQESDTPAPAPHTS